MIVLYISLAALVLGGLAVGLNLRAPKKNPERSPQNQRLIYQAVFEESLDVYSYTHVVDADIKKTSFKGGGKVQEYAGSEFLVIAFASTGEIVLVDKSRIKEIRLDGLKKEA